MPKTEPPIVLSLPAASSLPTAAPLIRADDVWFQYPPTDAVAGSEGKSMPWVLTNVTLSVNQGDRIAIVGANGQGKTTLVRVLMGEF